MAVLFCGVLLGFVLSTVLFINKVWSLQDKADHYKAKAKFLEEECVKQYRSRKEWEVCEDSSDLFKSF